MGTRAATDQHGSTRIWILVLLVPSVLFAVAAHCAPVRAAWVSGWGKGIYTRAEVDRTIASAKKAKLNLIFFDCRKAADAHYLGGIEPVARGVEPGFDPLGYAIKRAHANGIKLHACVSVYRIWKGKSKPADPNHLVNRRPKWLSYPYSGGPISSDGIFLNPAIPEATAYTTRVIVDVVSRYDVDGLQLDFIRYPHANWGYSTIATERYCTETGAKGKPLPSDPKWREWKRRQITLHVAAIRHAVHKVKPGLPISAATICWGDCPNDFADTFAYKHLGQDWKGWLARGLIDANCPMNYRSQAKPHEAGEFGRWLREFTRWGGGRPVYVGAATYLNSAPAVLRQVEEIERRGMDGFAIFSFNESVLCSAEMRGRMAEGLGGRGSR